MIRRIFSAFTNWRRLTLLVILIGDACLSRSQSTLPEVGTGNSVQVRRIDGVPYTSGAHGTLLSDLYLPPGENLHPAIVFLHGGAWKGGDRTQLQPVALSLAEKGYAGMAIDYDTTDHGDRFPVPLKEAEQAVEWLRKNASLYRIDPRRIAVAGSSAGGELAALVALDRNPLPGATVDAAIIFNGVLDLSYVGPDADDMVAPYLGGTCTDHLSTCKQASPVFQVRSAAPPFFVGHGTADRIVPYSQAETFVKLLRRKHVPVTSFVAQDAGHTYWKEKVWYSKNIDAVVRFLQNADAITSTRPTSAHSR